MVNARIDARTEGRAGQRLLQGACLASQRKRPVRDPDLAVRDCEVEMDGLMSSPEFTEYAQ